MELNSVKNLFLEIISADPEHKMRLQLPYLPLDMDSFFSFNKTHDLRIPTTESTRRITTTEKKIFLGVETFAQKTKWLPYTDDIPDVEYYVYFVNDIRLKDDAYVTRIIKPDVIFISCETKLSLGRLRTCLYAYKIIIDDNIVRLDKYDLQYDKLDHRMLTSEFGSGNSNKKGFCTYTLLDAYTELGSVIDKITYVFQDIFNKNSEKFRNILKQSHSSPPVVQTAIRYQ